MKFSSPNLYSMPPQQPMAMSSTISVLLSKCTADKHRLITHFRAISMLVTV